MWTCEESRVALAEQTFGEGDDAVERALSEHLLVCEPCQAEERRLRELHDRVRGPGIEVGEALRQRIRAALPRPIPAGFGLLRRPIPAYVAIAAGLVGALLVLLLPHARRAVVGSPRDENRGVGVPLDPGPAAFTVAQSYETRVSATGGAAPGRDSARAITPRGGDSL